MRTFPDVRFREVNTQMARGQQLIDDGKFEEGRQVLTEVRARAQRLGLSSGFVEWGLAIASDQLGELEMAYDHIVNAVRHDPLHTGYQNSFNVIMNHLRAALADPDRSEDDPSTPKLYGMLIAAGEADVPSHLSMSRHLAATGRHDEAIKLLDAVLLLAPVSRDAWLQKAALARTMGNPALATTCEAEAASIAQSDAPFGIPAPRGVAC